MGLVFNSNQCIAVLSDALFVELMTRCQVRMKRDASHIYKTRVEEYGENYLLCAKSHRMLSYTFVHYFSNILTHTALVAIVRFDRFKDMFHLVI